jgi:Amt family ammonium transporter
MRFFLYLAITIMAAPLQAQELSSGDTAWLLSATAFVLLMTLPGIALFYGGMVRSKNVLSIFMQCFAGASLVTVLWAIYGYSLVFMPGSWQDFLGGWQSLFLKSIHSDSLTGSIPESVYAVFQLTFAVITVALICGAVAERMRFSAFLLFIAFWFTLVYLPVAHWVWGSGWLGKLGAIDFAGGTVVHINSGVAGLIACLILGKRLGYPYEPMTPHNLTYTMIGACLLWVGWFGFNAGSALSANGTAGMALLVTQLASAMAALSWMFMEWRDHGRASALGLVSGSVAGLVGITPAAGNCGPGGALAIGLISGILCYYGATRLKRALGYDDSLDAFGIHGVGGIVGAVLTGVFASPALGGSGFSSGINDSYTQVSVQVLAVAATIAWDVFMTFIILKGLALIMPLRVTSEEEKEGLDISLHEEKGYNF